MKTEAEARKCWCPFVRTPFSTTEGISVAVNNAKTADDEGLTRCIASECMAWRREADCYEKSVGEHQVEIQGERGYCGLAGKP